MVGNHMHSCTRRIRGPTEAQFQARDRPDPKKTRILGPGPDLGFFSENGINHYLRRTTIFGKWKNTVEVTLMALTKFISERQLNWNSDNGHYSPWLASSIPSRIGRENNTPTLLRIFFVVVPRVDEEEFGRLLLGGTVSAKFGCADRHHNTLADIPREGFRTKCSDGDLVTFSEMSIGVAEEKLSPAVWVGLVVTLWDEEAAA